MIKLKDLLDGDLKGSKKENVSENINISMGQVHSNPYASSFKTSDQIKEDGHTDVSSAKRKLKTSIEDSQQLLSKLENMPDEDSLPSWWTDKITLSSNYLNSARDYLLNQTNEVTSTFKPKYSNPEAKINMDSDIKKMSNYLGKASQQIIKIMMDGVKNGKFDAMDIQRGIETGKLNRTHEGERPFMKMLWRKVRDGFRRYSKSGKLRK